MTDMIDRAARELFLADKAFRWPEHTWDQLDDDGREPYRRMTRRMFRAAGVVESAGGTAATAARIEVTEDMGSGLR